VLGFKTTRKKLDHIGTMTLVENMLEGGWSRLENKLAGLVVVVARCRFNGHRVSFFRTM